MTERRPPDQAARDAALDTRRSVIVQAPAGSGKTSLLTERFLRLLAVVESPEQILAMTFTRKAADEMRARILAALQAADDPALAHTQRASVLAAAKAALHRDKAEGWTLLAAPGRLQIMTVDALNSRILARRPLTAPGSGQRVFAEDELTRLYAEAADALLDWLNEPGEHASSVATYLDYLDGELDTWRRQLGAMLRRRDQWLPMVIDSAGAEAETLRRTCERVLGDLLDAACAALADGVPPESRTELHAVLSVARDNLPDSAPAQWPAEPPRTGPQAVAYWRFAARVLTTKKAWRRRLTVTDGFLDEDHKSRSLALLAALSEHDELESLLVSARTWPEPYYADAQWSLVLALLQVLRLLAGEFSRLCLERGGADYTELAARALGALGDADEVSQVALEYDYRLAHVLVDEMQDTSASQYRLLARLTEGWTPGDGRTVFCVGDPMQSIYRFRGADVGRFLEAWQDGIGDLTLDRIVLSTNFRADARLIDWCNQVFDRVIGQSTRAVEGALEFAPSTAAPGAPGEGTLTLRATLDDRAAEAAAVADEIAALHAAEPEASIAVLARSRTVLRRLLPELAARSVPVEAVELDRLTERPEVQDLITLTRVLEMPDDDVAWLGSLRMPMIGLDLAALDALMAVELPAPDTGVRERLRAPLALDALAPTDRERVELFTEAVDDIQRSAATQTLAVRVERLWARLGGPATLAQPAALATAEQYLATLDSMLTAGGLDAPARLWQSLEQQRVSVGTTGARVQLMTVYAAKGLEFDHVFLPALDATTRNEAQSALAMEVRHTDSGPGVIFAPAARSVDDEPLADLLRRLEATRDQHERSRLLYVAATRARRGLHLSATLRCDKDGTPQRPRSGSLLAMAWPALAGAFLAASREPVGESSATDQEGAAWRDAVHSRMGVWSAPALKLPPQPDVAAAAGTLAEVEYAWATDVARHVGTVVHGWLRALAGQPDPAARDWSSDDVRARSRMALARLGVPSGELESATERVVSALQTGLASPTGQWLLASDHPDNAAELALVSVRDGRTERLVVDRIVRDDENSLWIVDYKTSRHEGGDLQRFFDNERRRYREQLERYKAAVCSLPRYRDTPATAVRTGLYLLNYGQLIELQGQKEPS